MNKLILFLVLTLSTHAQELPPPVFPEAPPEVLSEEVKQEQLNAIFQAITKRTPNSLRITVIETHLPPPESWVELQAMDLTPRLLWRSKGFPEKVSKLVHPQSCPFCTFLGKLSRVKFTLPAEAVNPNLGELEVDELGQVHRHQGNQTLVLYKCSEGHEWRNAFRITCPVPGCEK